jgi:tripartite-type tricarboxylate transporter receptor subunit TctC
VPEVPTLDELGLKGFDADAMFGFYAPANTPDAVVKRLNTEINRALNQAAIKDRIVAMGNVPHASTAEAFGQKGADDFRRLGAIIRERGIKGD